MNRLDIPAELVTAADDYEAETAFIEAALRAESGEWFEIWRPDTTEADYDVVRWERDDSVEGGSLVTLPPFAEVAAETPVYLEQIGARS